MEIIAEIGQNHNGDISKAKELIYAVKDSGAEVAKFQLLICHLESIYKKTKIWKRNGRNIIQKHV